MVEWGDLRFLLHVVREGSTLAASRVLNTSQSTVMRRIAVLEGQLGLSLFEKRRSGYVPTDTLLGLLGKLEAVEAAHSAFESEARVICRGLSGTVRLTTPELISSHFLKFPLQQFRQLNPDIRIELVASDDYLDLSWEADIALRAGDPPTDGALFGRRIINDTWSVYCSRAYAEANGYPTTTADFGKHGFICIVERARPDRLTEWMNTHFPPDNIVLRHSSLMSAFFSVKAGDGIGICPDMIGMNEPEFIRCMPVDVQTGKEVWLLAHERNRQTPRIRIVLDFLTEHLMKKVQTMRLVMGEKV